MSRKLASPFGSSEGRPGEEERRAETSSVFPILDINEGRGFTVGTRSRFDDRA
jgi:hypothetical protein